MAKVTSKLQVTVPRAIARQYGIRPGDDIEWVPAGDVIHVVSSARPRTGFDVATRLRLFDAATERQRLRQGGRKRRAIPVRRGWRREDLYGRGRAG